MFSNEGHACFHPPCFSASREDSVKKNSKKVHKPIVPSEPDIFNYEMLFYSFHFWFCQESVALEIFQPGQL